jgi:hypothetical protein
MSIKAYNSHTSPPLSGFPVREVHHKKTALAERILKSPCTLSLADAGVFTGLTAATLISVAVGAPLLVSACFASALAVSMAAFAVFVFIKKEVIWFEVTFLAVRVSCVVSRFLHSHISKKIPHQRWYNTIPTTHVGSHCLVLGALPLFNKGHHRKICSLPGAKTPAVLSVLKLFENNRANLFSDPVRRVDWKQLKVDQKQIEISDLQGLPVKRLNEGADFIHSHIQQQRSVYVHCKAGRGRSLMLVAAYLMKYENGEVAQQRGKNFVDKALNIVKSVRPQIRATSVQMRSLKAFATALHH